MTSSAPTASRVRPTLHADTAADLMMPNPVSIRADATIREAVALFTDKGLSAAPVIDDAGHPIGVLSRTDILRHEGEKEDHLALAPEFYQQADLTMRSGEKLGRGFQVVNVDQTRVSDLMTPVVWAVAPATSAAKVVEEMLARRVHRLFVVESTGVLVGVISALDILRALRA